MSFPAYSDTIKAKTGLDPEDFRPLAREGGLLKPGVTAGQLKDWLKSEFDLCPGHAMALISILTPKGRAAGSTDDRIDTIFAGPRAHWRSFVDSLIEQLRSSGDEVTVAPTITYLSLVSHGREFAILQPTGDRLDVGIRRTGIPPDRSLRGRRVVECDGDPPRTSHRRLGARFGTRCGTARLAATGALRQLTRAEASARVGQR